MSSLYICTTEINYRYLVPVLFSQCKVTAVLNYIVNSAVTVKSAFKVYEVYNVLLCSAYNCNLQVSNTANTYCSIAYVH